MYLKGLFRQGGLLTVFFEEGDVPSPWFGTVVLTVSNPRDLRLPGSFSRTTGAVDPDRTAYPLHRAQRDGRRLRAHVLVRRPSSHRSLRLKELSSPHTKRPPKSAAGQPFPQYEPPRPTGLPSAPLAEAPAVGLFSLPLFP